MAEVKTGVSTNRMLCEHYTPMAHSLQCVECRSFAGLTVPLQPRRLISRQPPAAGERWLARVALLQCAGLLDEP